MLRRWFASLKETLRITDQLCRTDARDDHSDAIYRPSFGGKGLFLKHCLDWGPAPGSSQSHPREFKAA
jgi:hypothetical protein